MYFVIPAKAGIQSNNRIVQIQLIRILTFDQFQFPKAFPTLSSLLSHNYGFHALMQFAPNQLMNLVMFGKPFDPIILRSHILLTKLEVTPT
jgi:hypothetical protein